jgi:hypothetical protein
MRERGEGVGGGFGGEEFGGRYMHAHAPEAMH